MFAGTGEPPDHFEAWVRLLFETPERLHDISLLQVERVRLVSHLLGHLSAAIAPYDNDRIARAIETIFYESASEIPAAIKGNACPLDERLACLRQASSLYRDGFEPRCRPVLSHRNEPGGGRLERVCYMLWDNSGLLHWQDGREAVLEVLEAGLACGNPACQESALHGLGHLAGGEPRTAGIIDRFIDERGGTIRPELVAYAKLARSGRIA